MHGTHSFQTRRRWQSTARGMLLLALCVALPWGREVTAESNASLEYKLKAVFLLNFVKFVEWPEDAFTDDNEPIRICALGDDPFGSLMEETLKGETVNGRALVVKRTRKVEDAKACHVVFIAGSEKSRLGEMLSKINGGHVLTVGEDDRFLELGGVIRFTTIEGKVRFEINEEAAVRSHLKISSKLLKLASTVKPKKE